MKPIFFLIPLFLILSLSLIPNSYAEIEKGKNYDKEIIQINNDGTHTERLTIIGYDRITDESNVYQDSIFTGYDDYLKLDTGFGSIKLDKTTCSFSYFNDKDTSTPLFTDSIVPKMAEDGTENFSIITSVNNASCETYGSNYQLVAKKYSSGIGFYEYKYIFNNGKWKTQLEATNLSSMTTKKFGFTQTIDLNRDSIKYDNVTKNLDDFNNVVLNRDWIETHESKIIDFLNGYSFDFDLGFNNLKSINIYDTGLNKSKLSFNYLYNTSIILPNETLIIDPTITQSSSATMNNLNLGSVTQKDAIRVLSGSVLVGKKLNSVNFYLFKPNSPTGTIAVQLQDSSGTIKETSATTLDPSTLTGACSSYTFSFSGSTTVSVGDRIVNDGSGVANGNWYSSCGVTPSAIDYFELSNYAPSTWTDVSTYDHQFVITYSSTIPPWAVTDLTSTGTTQTTASLDWTQPYLGGGNQALIGYQINKTTPWGLPTVLVNDTGTATSDYIATGLTSGTNYSFRVSAWTNNTNGHPYNNATGNILNVTTSTLNPPSAPTLSALSESDTSVRFTSVNGTTNDRNMFYYGLRCVENGLGSWVTIVSNSTTPSPRLYSYTGLNPLDSVTCQWRDGSLAGFGSYSANATGTTGQIGIIQDERSDHADKLKDFETWIADEGGLYFGLGVFPMVIMLIGFMATKGTVRIFTLISLSAMGILHASGYFVYPTWYWTLAILFGIVLILGRQARD